MKHQYLLFFAALSLPILAQADSPWLLNSDNGHYYKRYDAALGWNASKAACQQKSAYLATVTSQEENDWIVANINNTLQSSWLGGSDVSKEGSWRWVSGEPFQYSHWGDGEPNNSGEGEDYLLLYAETGEWNDFTEESMLSYICEWEPLSAVVLDMQVLPDINYNGYEEYVLLGQKGKNYVMLVYEPIGTAQGDLGFISETVISPKAGYSVKYGGFLDSDDTVAILLENTKKKMTELRRYEVFTGNLLRAYTLPTR